MTYLTRARMAVLAVTAFLVVALGANPISAAKEDLTREAYLGKLISYHLQSAHYSGKKLNDKLSSDAFEQYLKRLDFNKRFLLASDVAVLKNFADQMDDEIQSGQYQLAQVSAARLHERVSLVQTMVDELLKNPFDFTKDERFETDPDKRKFVDSTEALRERWRKILKYSSLSRLSLKESEHKESTDANKGVYDPISAERDVREALGKSFNTLFKRMLQTDETDHLERFINSVAAVFDPHTEWFPPAKKENFDIGMSGKLEGIGALLEQKDQYIRVVRIIPGSASWRQGDLKGGDVILKVGQGKEDPVDVVDMRLSDAVRLIRGPKGSVVRLTVKKSDGRIVAIPIVRDVVKLEDTFAKGAIVKHEELGISVGYIYLPKFYRDFNSSRLPFGKKGRNCTDDVRKYLEAFNAANVDSVILDLRNNGGGALEDAKLMSGLFINRGPIVQVKRSDNKMRVLEDTDGKVVYDGPLVVMVNRFSASASEILAAALQDYGRAVVVGSEHSHGKGTVQTIYNLTPQLRKRPDWDPFGALKITIQKFYRINGGSTQYRGVSADVILPDRYGYIESGERFQDHSLKWDEVAPLTYTRWKEELPMDALRAKSTARVAKHPKFEKIKGLVEKLDSQRKDTMEPLAYEKYQTRRKEAEAAAEGFKYNDEVKAIVITENLETLVGSHSIEHLEQQKKDEAEDKKEDVSKGDEEEDSNWLLNVRKDPYIEESIHILGDLIKHNTK